LPEPNLPIFGFLGSGKPIMKDYFWKFFYRNRFKSNFFKELNRVNFLCWSKKNQAMKNLPPFQDNRVFARS